MTRSRNLLPAPLPRAAAAATLFLSLATGTTAGAAVLVDSWYTSLIDGKRVGYYHEVRETDVEGGRRIVRTTSSSAYTLRRMGTEVVVESQASFVETAEGEPLRFENRSKLAKSDYVTRAERRGDVFVVTQEALGKRTETEVPFTADILFPNAMERAILERGLKPDARLELRTFSPDAARPTRIVFVNAGPEAVDLQDGRKVTLLRTETEQDVFPGLKLVEWRDTGGVPQKTSLPILGMEIVSFRTTREKALLDPEGVELLVSTLLKSNVRIPRPRITERVRYLLRLRDGRADLNPPQDSRQRIVSRDGAAVVLEVRRESWRKRPELSQPGDVFLRASAALQSDDKKVMELARQAAPGGGSREQVAKAITRWVHSAIVKKSLSIGLGTAAEVARDLSGDCTEHAVLAAAMARARNIPSRIAMGLVYVDGVFGYHMWTEVFDEGWHAIDPALGEEATDATHVKLAETALDQGFSDEALLGIVRDIANLDLEVIEYEVDGKTYGTSGEPVGRIEEGVYRNDAYGLRIESPRKWALRAPSPAAAGTGALLALTGPNGMAGELHATSTAVDFRMSDWLSGRYPDLRIAATAPITIADRPGRRYFLEGKGRPVALLAVLDGGTLFTVHVDLGLSAGGRTRALDDVARAIHIKD